MDSNTFTIFIISLILLVYIFIKIKKLIFINNIKNNIKMSEYFRKYVKKEHYGNH